jgi:hypothetical protein
MGSRGRQPSLAPAATRVTSMQEAPATDTCSAHQSEVQPYKPLFHDCFAVPVLVAMLGSKALRVTIKSFCFMTLCTNNGLPMGTMVLIRLCKATMLFRWPSVMLFHRRALTRQVHFSSRAFTSSEPEIHSFRGSMWRANIFSPAKGSLAMSWLQQCKWP